MNIRPLGDRVLIEPIEEKEQKVGGIIIPDSAKEKPMQGKVVAVGKKLDKDGNEITNNTITDGSAAACKLYTESRKGQWIRRAKRCRLRT